MTFADLFSVLCTISIAIHTILTKIEPSILSFATLILCVTTIVVLIIKYVEDLK